jgi:acetyl-CoA C-acetyltransferase
MAEIAGTTPVLVGAGQTVEREATDASPMALAARAAAAAIEDCAAPAIAAAIDTIAVVKLFSDSVPRWAGPFGRSNNPPQSIASRIGAAPRSRIYTEPGGNEPQSRLIEFARDIARGECEVVLLAGAEAIRNQRQAERQGRALDWTEHHDAPLEDRGYERERMVTMQEIHNGLVAPMYFYTLIEQAQARAAGRSAEAHRAHAARLMAGFSAVAARNPYAQFPGALDEREIAAAPLLTQLYTRRMVAQDGVNQGAALLLTSVAKARALGIPPSRWVYLHGMAEGAEWRLSERPDLGRAPMAAAVLERAFAIAGVGIGDIGALDIYSCFPCAVSALADCLGLPDDGSRALTLTGGLPYFGGPGNNYSMHAIAEMVWRLRRAPREYGLVTANGGMLSKHAAGIYSCRPSPVDWARADTRIAGTDFPRLPLAEAPETGRIVSHCVAWEGGEPARASVIAETAAGERFAACTAPADRAVATALLEGDPTGRAIRIVARERDTLHFRPDETA